MKFSSAGDFVQVAVSMAGSTPLQEPGLDILSEYVNLSSVDSGVFFLSIPGSDFSGMVPELGLKFIVSS